MTNRSTLVKYENVCVNKSVMQINVHLYGTSKKIVITPFLEKESSNL